MRLLRLVTALLLIVTLPAYAWSSLGLSERCAMQDPPPAALAEGGHACCDPMDPADGSGGESHPCKAGQDCKGGSLYHPGIESVDAPVPAVRVVSPIPRHLFVSQGPPGVWRPPRSL